VSEPVHGRVTEKLGGQIAGRPLPGELATDLDLAQAQVVERHHDDQTLGAMPKQALPELATCDRLGHLEQHPGELLPAGLLRER
jgi:hypothetical protein